MEVEFSIPSNIKTRMAPSSKHIASSFITKSFLCTPGVLSPASFYSFTPPPPLPSWGAPGTFSQELWSVNCSVLDVPRPSKTSTRASIHSHGTASRLWSTALETQRMTPFTTPCVCEIVKFIHCAAASSSEENAGITVDSFNSDKEDIVRYINASNLDPSHHEKPKSPDHHL